MNQNRVQITVTAADKGATATIQGTARAARESKSSWDVLRGSIGKVVGAYTGLTLATKAFQAVFGRGFTRLADLEEADRRFKQMGLSLDTVNMLMGTLNDTLTGTPYALNEGANAMTQLVSAGMQIRDVPDAFNDLVDVAAFTQAPLEEVTNIFVKIQSEGRLTGRTLRELAIRGAPALTLLASAANKTQEEMRDMIFAGEVSAQEFFDLWSEGAKGFGADNLIIEGSAQSMGDTTRGVVRNMNTAFARLGATILKSVFPAFRATAEGATKLAKVLQEMSKDLTDNKVLLVGLAAALIPVTVRLTQMGVAASVNGAKAVASFIAMRIHLIRLSLAMGHTGRAIKLMFASLGPVGIAIAAVGFAMEAFTSTSRGASASQQALADSMNEVTAAATEQTAQVLKQQLQERGGLKAANELGIAYDQLANAIMGTGDSYDSMLASLNETIQANMIGQGTFNSTGESALVLQAIIKDMAKEYAGAQNDVLELSGTLSDQALASAEAQANMDELREATQAYFDAIKAATDPFFQLESALDKVESAQKAYNDAVKESGTDSAAAKEAATDLAKAVFDAQAAASDADLNFGTMNEQLQAMYERGLITADQLAVMQQQIAETSAEADRFAEPRVAEIRVGVNDQSLAAANAVLNSLTGTRRATVYAEARSRYTSASSRARGGITGAANGGVRDGLTAVGENGMELLELPPSTNVRTAPDTQRLLEQAGRQTEQKVTFDFTGTGDVLEQALVEVMRRASRRLGGGNVQQAFGS